MSLLTGRVEHVIGVDTHRDTNTAAVVTAAGAVVAHQQCSTDALDYRRVMAFADEHAHGRRVWAIEGTGSFGSGLTAHLLERGEWVVEIDRPAGRPGATAPRPTISTPCAPPAKRFPAITSPRLDRAVTAKPCAFCSPPGKAPSWRAPRPSVSSRP